MREWSMETLVGILASFGIGFTVALLAYYTLRALWYSRLPEEQQLRRKRWLGAIAGGLGGGLGAYLGRLISDYYAAQHIINTIR